MTIFDMLVSVKLPFIWCIEHVFATKFKKTFFLEPVQPRATGLYTKCRYENMNIFYKANQNLNSNNIVFINPIMPF